MNEQNGAQRRPVDDNKEALMAIWKEQGQPWRTEPEIDAERQKYLSELCSNTLDIEQHKYPFKNIELSRADVEWLLWIHENGREPVAWSDESQGVGDGLNFFGVNLSNVNLDNLPLAKASFRLAKLENTSLVGAKLQGADLRWADLEGAKLSGVTFSDQTYGPARFADISWGKVNLAVVDWEHITTLGDEQLAHQTKDINDYQAAVRANRQLAVVLQEQGIIEAAANYSYRAQINQRHLLLLQVLQNLEQHPKLRWLVIQPSMPQNYLFFLKPMIGFTITPLFLILFLYLTAWNIGSLPLGLLLPVLPIIIVSSPLIPLLALVLLYYIPLTRLILITLPLTFLYGGFLLLVFLFVILMIEHPIIILSLLYFFLFSICFTLIGIRQADKIGEIKGRMQYRYSLILPYFSIQKQFGRYLFSLLLDILAGYGYRPGRTLFWYLFVIFGFATAYYAYGGIHLFPDAFIFSLTSFHGRGFFPSLGYETSLHSPLVVLASLEAVVGLLIEISFIATFTQKYFGK